MFRKHLAGPGGGPYSTETQTLNEFVWCLENTEQGQVEVLAVLKHNHLWVAWSLENTEQGQVEVLTVLKHKHLMSLFGV